MSKSKFDVVREYPGRGGTALFRWLDKILEQQGRTVNKGGK
jgi:hypothetical protein